MNNKSILAEFLTQEKFDVTLFDFEKECKKIMCAMEDGLQKDNNSSLSMLLTYIDPQKLRQDESTILVIDAGGTNFRTALLTFKDNTIQINDFEKADMPGTKSEITASQFFEIIVDRIERKVDKAQAIGFCFSYPTEIMPDRDGKVIYLTKEVSVNDIDGKLLGKGIKDELLKRNKRPLPVTVLNDTVAGLLGGMAEHPGYDSYFGYILGTGTNLAYIEKNANINKVSINKNGSMIINLESGGYNGFPKGDCDLRHIQATKIPSMYQAEKVMSGAYLGTLAAITLKKAGEVGLFCTETVRRMHLIEALETKEIGAYSEGAESILDDLTDIAEEKETVKRIIDAIIERSAMFSAIVLTAAITKNSKPNNRVCITAEGTTWYKLSHYNNRVNKYLIHYLTKKYHINYTIVQVDDATLIGSATAALCQ